MRRKITINNLQRLLLTTILFIGGVLFFSSTALAVGPQGVDVGWPIDNNGNVLLDEAMADRIVESGAGWVRLNFRLGPYPSDTGEFYSTYDIIVNRLRSRGLQIVGLMTNESWPGSQPDWQENNWENTGGDGYNMYLDQFGYAFARMASHWEGGIKYWEIWNEPNCWSENPTPGVYQGCSYIYPSNFAALLTHVHSQAHYYNQLNVKIISGGLFGHDIGGFGTSQAGADYLDSTYDVGINHTGKFAWAKNTYGDYPLDLVGQHIYINQGDNVSTNWFGQYLDYIHDVLVYWEGDATPKKTWLTEFGWSTDSVNEAGQSNNLDKAFEVIRNKNYVIGTFWFQLDDNPAANMYFGIYRFDLTKKPVWSTYKTWATYQGKLADGTTNTSILNYYNDNGGMAAYGSPYDNGGTPWVHWWDFGYVQDIDGGSVGDGAIFDTGYRVILGFWDTYLQDDNHSLLRFPMSDEYPYGNGTRQDFQGGYMTWDPTNGIQVFVY